MIEGKLLQPLTLDVNAFKRRYKSLVGLSSFERANLKALEHKRAAWAAYRPLATEQLYDTLDNMNITILNPFASRAPRRSTVNGVLYGQTSTVHRPTEHLAVAHALGLFKFPEEDLFERQVPDRKVRWCITCKAFRPIELFEKDRHNPSGLAFCCTKCRKDLDRGIWRKAA